MLDNLGAQRSLAAAKSGSKQIAILIISGIMYILLFRLLGKLLLNPVLNMRIVGSPAGTNLLIPERRDRNMSLCVNDFSIKTTQEADLSSPPTH